MIDYKNLLEIVITDFFGEQYSPDEKGMIEWLDITDKEIKRCYEKSGKVISKQRRKYKVIELFEKKEERSNSIKKFKVDFGSSHNNIYISRLENNNKFYVVTDIKYGMTGGKIRYGFTFSNGKIIKNEMVQILIR